MQNVNILTCTMYITLQYCFSQFPLLFRQKKRFLLAQVNCCIFIFLRFGQICHFKASFYKKASFYNKLFFEKKNRGVLRHVFFADVCDKCIIRNGVGFNPHPENCYKFVQCYFGAKGEIRSAIRSCPFGQYWDQDALTCKLAKQVSCPKGTPLFQIS